MKQDCVKRLFTPGPLSTSPTVRNAMLRDLGSRDAEFLQLVAKVRAELLFIAGVRSSDGYQTVLLPGSGTYGVEAALGSAVGPTDQLLVVVNGAYGRRMEQIASTLNLRFTTVEFDDCELPRGDEIESALRARKATHLAMVHCETTTGILNPVKEVVGIAKRYKVTTIIDAMSSFGGVPLDIRAWDIDYLVSSSNKCLQGVPGLTFVICRTDALNACSHRSPSVSLDLRAQLAAFDANGQFRFTPPTHVLLALEQALSELKMEGGVDARARRYATNHQVLIAGMKELGFQATLADALQSHVITAFNFPATGNFDFEIFYQSLAAQGFIIYPGKLTKTDSFRIGNIGHLFESDMHDLLQAIAVVMNQFERTQHAHS